MCTAQIILPFFSVENFSHPLTKIRNLHENILNLNDGLLNLRNWKFHRKRRCIYISFCSNRTKSVTCACWILKCAICQLHNASHSAGNVTYSASENITVNLSFTFIWSISWWKMKWKSWPVDPNYKTFLESLLYYKTTKEPNSVSVQLKLPPKKLQIRAIGKQSTLIPNFKTLKYHGWSLCE